MKGLRTTTGPFDERPYFKLSEIETICLDELISCSLLPEHPEPVRIERFIERRFGVTPQYADLPDGLLGFTRFTENGVDAIFITRSLDEEGTKIAERRLRTTLAHESGHGLLHAHLFSLGSASAKLFDDEHANSSRIMCREIPSVSARRRTYDGKWWEFQANQAMGALLLPRSLVLEAMRPHMIATGSLGQFVPDEDRRERAVRELAEVFEVNPVVAGIRVAELFPPANSQQLEL